MFKKYAARAGVVLGTVAMAAGATMGSASAAEGVGYIGTDTTSGSGVWCVQHLANDVARKAGHATVDEDGKWGPKTKAQVVWFQDRLGLKKDGIVGPETGDYLLYFGDQYYGGTGGYCNAKMPSDWRLGAMYVHTRLD
ncbi:peptidoglycan-binding domain-containing protein [Streptomyces triculaminicus]|uniref:peptidoglycan-binding domain-containing protein n=1 Tax=Streptomyces triculaminicus TaxID=2816232 RepID=UPI003400496D